MLKLAKPESKKEMDLKRRKKSNNIQSKHNYIKLTGRTNNVYPNNKPPENRIKHKIIKKSDIIKHNSSTDNINKNNDLKHNSSLLLKNKQNSQKKHKLIPAMSATSYNDKKEKIISLKNKCNSKSPINVKQCECQSVRSKKYIEKPKDNNENSNTYNILNFQKEKRLDTEDSDIVKNVDNSRVRKLFAMSSDIFNLNDTATTLYRKTYLSPQKPNTNKRLYKNNNKSNINIYNDNIYTIFNINKKENTAKNKKSNYNRINILNRSQYNKNETNNLCSTRKKTNKPNIESVKYDIITTKKSNLFDKYKDLSGIPASFSKVEDYEIIVPKNYNQANVNQLTGVLSSNGIHYFDLIEKGDIIGGQKGKFMMKVRLNGQNEIKNNRMINKTSQKLSKYNVKLKKNIYDYGKKKTDITGLGWDEAIVNGFY